jgi:hypothetical protein
MLEEIMTIKTINTNIHPIFHNPQEETCSFSRSNGEIWNILSQNSMVFLLQEIAKFTTPLKSKEYWCSAADCSNSLFSLRVTLHQVNNSDM